MSFPELHDQLRSVAQDLLAKDTDWPLLAQAGWVGLDVPEEFGGAGATLAEVAVIAEEIGRAAASTSYLGGAVLGIGALLAVRAGESRDRLLRDVTAGTVRVALALSAEQSPQEFELAGRIHGHATFVPDVTVAHRVLLPARDPAGEPVLIDVASDAAGLHIEHQPVLDATRQMCAVTAGGVEADAAAVWRFDGDPHARLQALRDRAAVAVACDSLGIAQAMLDATVSYVRVRHQFGQPVGAFQAVKHACADMLVRISVARRLVASAVNDPNEITAAMAKAYACDTAVEVAGKAMQLHGGIGYTWESGVHVYLKRAALNRSLFGSSAAHRARLAERYQ
ncbi:acyl-CoA dehydrogenase [Mycobacterium sp. 852013-50091_SCH5140682]|uniref:acyl-CoA dehydrogenase family protein n=1 Tax=Mycobacterium sp. 852013-50091_SCH5140682 TaxID=1834109 RepID=UPI0007E99F95|nr:acyl-CoA dehydrogenase family protein [Mycobacterium sp. 852013-50091_SCH5140682]OBC10739.1 acyl-CoA dehydrogenase [Mycobacterium sp. 852013-50091_SCH5140682]